MKSRSIVFPSYKEVNSTHFHYLIGNKMCRELYSRCVPNAKKNWFSLYMHSFIYFFVFWPCWVIHTPRALLWLWRVGAALQSQGAGFPPRWILPLCSAGSGQAGSRRCSSWALEHGLTGGDAGLMSRGWVAPWHVGSSRIESGIKPCLLHW